MDYGEDKNKSEDKNEDKSDVECKHKHEDKGEDKSTSRPGHCSHQPAQTDHAQAIAATNQRRIAKAKLI